MPHSPLRPNPSFRRVRSFWGWSLAFSETGSAYIGNLKYFALRNVNEAPSIGTTRLPANLYMVYQGMFAGITAVLAMGGFAERGRFGPMLLFSFCWLTIVYCPIGEFAREPLLSSPTRTLTDLAVSYRCSLLDLELERMVVHHGRTRLRRRNARPHQLWNRLACPCLLLGQAPGIRH